MPITKQEINDAYNELKNCHEDYGEALKHMNTVKERKADAEGNLYYQNAVKGSNAETRTAWLRNAIPGSFVDIEEAQDRLYDTKTALEVAQAEVARIEALLKFHCSG